MAANLEWYYTQPPVINVSQSNIIDTGSLVTVSSFSNYANATSTSVSALTISTASNSSNIGYLLGKIGNSFDDGGILDDIIGGVVTGGVETFGDYLLWLLQNNDTLRDGFNRLVDDLVGDLIPSASNTGFGGDANNAALGSNQLQADFRFLSSNPFAIDRATTYNYNYGLALAGKDISLTPSANICYLPDSFIYQGVYGAQYTNSMTTGSKRIMFETATQSWFCCNAYLGTSVQSPRVFTSNALCSNAWTSNAFTSNLSVNSITGPGSTVNVSGSVNATGGITTSGTLTANNATVNSLTVGPAFSPYAAIDASGNATAYTLTVNGNSFWIQANGNVFVNGTQIVDGPNKTVIVYDDQIRQRSSRGTVNQVLSGNIGTADTAAFNTGAPLYPTATTARPLNFSTLTNQANQSQILNNLLNSATFDANGWVVFS